MAQAPDEHALTELPGPRVDPEERAQPMRSFAPELLQDWHIRCGILLLAVGVFFPGLGSFGLWDPWEVHYGAVGWGFMERGDWISPWWGSYWTAPGESMEGSYFFSKPVLLLWMMGIGMEWFGYGPFGIRFGVATLATLAVVSVYLMGSRVFSRRVGVLMSFTLVTSPFFAMLGRQAQTEIPFVAPMTIALSFFLMGAFGKDRNQRADKLTWTLFAAFIALVTVPQLHTITVGQMTWKAHLHPVEAFFCYGPTQLGIYALGLGGVALSLVLSKQQTRGQVYLLTFYAFVGLATMGKGILGFALPGAIIFLYLLVSREWRMLARLEIPRGVVLTLCVGMPWYGAMLARHGGIGGAWWQRFIVHDHFKRLASGVHQTDTGSFEHFIRWLGYGLFPWGSFVPAIIARAVGGDAGGQRDDKDRARLFLFLWFATAFTLFTLSSTKFHHYIFPAVPAIALLAALFLDDMLEQRVDNATFAPLYIAGFALLVLVGFDLMTEPQHLKNMFTYKYDRRWDHATWDPGISLALRVFVVWAIAGYFLLSCPRRGLLTRVGLGVIGAQALVTVLWALNVYMPAISSTWSQQGLWDTYYALCTPIDPPPGAHPQKYDRYCEESAIAYKLNWRGETYYTMNEVLPIRDDEEWDYFVEMNDGRCFYGIMEQSRVASFRNAVPAEQRDTVQEVPIINPDGSTEQERAAIVAERHARAAEEEGDDDPYRGWTFWERVLEPGYLGDDNIKFALVRVGCEGPLPGEEAEVPDADEDAETDEPGEDGPDDEGPSGDGEGSGSGEATPQGRNE